MVGFESEEAAVLRASAAGILSSTRAPPTPNITSTERQALKSIKEDASIVILPADKGRATVVMDKVAYEEKVQTLLSDTTTYTPLTKDPTSEFQTKIARTIMPIKEYIPFTTYCRIKP